MTHLLRSCPLNLQNAKMLMLNKMIFLQPVNENSTEMTIKINYSPISLGKLRIWASVHHSFKSMKDLGR